MTLNYKWKMAIMSLITSKTRYMLKRGADGVADTYTGPVGELTIDKDGLNLHIQNAVAAGGVKIPGVTRSTVPPEILSPYDGASLVSRQPILICAPYQGDGTHVSTHWQVTRDGSFQTVDYLSGDDDLRLTQYSLGEVNVTLEPETTYFVRCRQRSSLGVYTEWSSAKSFTTARANESFQYSQRITSVSGEGVGDALALSADGEVLVSGEQRFDSSVQNSGQVTVYRRTTGSDYIVEQIHSNPNPTHHDVLFGYAVAISGNGLVIAVGAPRARSGTASATWIDGTVTLYRFLNGFWYREGTIASPTLVDGGRFGHSVKLNHEGTRLAVGEPLGGIGGNGALHVFEPINGQWRAVHSVSPDSYATPDPAEFGWAVDMNEDGTLLACGAPGADSTMTYSIVGGVMEALGTLMRPGTINTNRFGESVSMNGTGMWLAVGAPEYSDENVTRAGRGYIYNYTGSVWQLTHAAESPDPISHRRYGKTVALAGAADTCLIGAIKRPLVVGSIVTESVGAVDVLGNGGAGWVVRGTLDSTAPVRDLEFGTALAVSHNGEVAAVGSTNANNGLGDIHLYTF